jgi:hypothetical protein
MIARPPPANMKLNIEGQFLKTRASRKRKWRTPVCVCVYKP